MKNTKFLLFALVLLAGLMIMGCKNDTNPLSGNTYSVTEDGETITVKFTDDTNCSMTASEEEGTETGTYTVDGSTVTITAEGDTFTGTTTDDWKTFTLDVFDELIFTRQ